MSVHRRVVARDRGLARVSRITSMTLGGGLALSGGFAVLAAHAYAGQSHRVVVRAPLPAGVQSTPRASATSVAPTSAAPLTAPTTLPTTAPSGIHSTTAPTVPRTTPPTVPATTTPTTSAPVFVPAPPTTIVSGGS
jgi:hypothetical protein